jgi:cyanate permease
MRTHPGRTLSVLVIGSVMVLGALGLVLTVEPGIAPAIILVGVVTGLFLYGVMYVIERRRHW